MTSIIGTFLKWFFGGFVVLAIVLFSLNALGLELRSYFGVKSADVERTIYKESASFVDGKRLEAGRLFRQYNQANTEAEKQIILNATAHQMAYFDHERHLTGDIKEFVSRAKRGVP